MTGIVNRVAEDVHNSITHEHRPTECVLSDSPSKSGRKKQSTSNTILADFNWDEDNSCYSSNEPTKKGKKKYGFCKNIGQGIVEDFKQTIGTHWLKEMINFNQKTIAVSFFLFFAAIAPAITFGE